VKSVSKPTINPHFLLCRRKEEIVFDEFLNTHEAEKKKGYSVCCKITGWW
jgi:hypothetical protein